MKRLTIILLCLALSVASLAQTKRHYFSLGVDYMEYAYPKDWNSNAINRVNHTRSTLWKDKGGVWFVYSYKNSFAIKLYNARIYQAAWFKKLEATPYHFLETRDAQFFDVLLGYNLKKHLEYFLDDRINIWGFIGVTYLGNFSKIDYVAYDFSHLNWNGHWGAIENVERNNYDKKLKPTAQLNITYNPFRHLLIGIGGTYHPIGKDFKPVSGNISLGVQF